ncbi:Uma2 family endonuclease [Nonomuraea typhae]|uniref:Uma2 family endonuclease n=1 Tax=Nonomuraea typhae TaxID=2603600 RepID=A0ABW7YTB7_9ACTN
MAKLLARPTAEDDLLAQYRTVCTLFDPQRVELIHGRIVVNDVPTWKHNKIISRLLKQILAKATEEDWEVGTNTILFLGAQKDRYIPDLTVAPPDPKMFGDDAVHADDTILVVEVVSPSSVNDDYLTKPPAYAAGGVPAFLRIDPLKSRADLFSQPSAGGYIKHTDVKFGGEIKLPAPWNLTLDTAVFNDAEPTEDQPA